MKKAGIVLPQSLLHIKSQKDVVATPFWMPFVGLVEIQSHLRRTASEIVDVAV